MIQKIKWPFLLTIKLKFVFERYLIVERCLFILENILILMTFWLLKQHNVGVILEVVLSKESIILKKPKKIERKETELILKKKIGTKGP